MIASAHSPERAVCCLVIGAALARPEGDAQPLELEAAAAGPVAASGSSWLEMGKAGRSTRWLRQETSGRWELAAADRDRPPGQCELVSGAPGKPAGARGRGDGQCRSLPKPATDAHGEEEDKEERAKVKEK
ncbi:hypothetical protein PVAP13_7KG160555 [Panicum virgatum]|uniref:Uncharacterized protein n=1 Tax=Panicum virgatum TaxID=38727 RepID=A0A8T0QGB5_PANVG|nr:hypothetical protein PVAP13_7KG160555 [Panicum virgatum]